MHRDLIVIAASLAQKPRHGGHAWALLQYALGFRDLGWDVLVLDRISSSACVDATGQPCAAEDSVNARYLRGLMRRFDLGNHFALIVDDGKQWIGVDRDWVFEEVRRSAFLLNIMGFLSQADLLEAAPRRVFLDIDPDDAFAGHDTHVTIGERIGESLIARFPYAASIGSRLLYLRARGLSERDRYSRLDVRVSKRLQLTQRVRLTGNFNVFNVLNSSAIQVENTT